MSWTTIWNEDGAILDHAETSQHLSAATFLLEARRGAQPAQAMWSGAGDNAVSVAAVPDGALELRHRSTVLRSEPGIVQPGEAFRLMYRSAEDGQTTLEMRSIDRPGIACVSRTHSNAPLNTTDFSPTAPIIDRFGGLAALANHNAPSADGCGLQVGTMVATPSGERPIETLGAGDVVMIGRNTRAVVQRTERSELVSLGSMNAVRLRAPFFGLREDVHVTRQTQIRLSGPEIEYAFGEESVTAEAGDLVNRRSVLRDLSEPIRDFVTVTLDRPGCLRVGRLGISGQTDASNCPQVDRIAAQSVLASVPDMGRLLR